MKLNIKSKHVENGVLHQDFGGYGKHPEKSFELTWDKVENAKSYAIVLVDYDAVHVVGFPYIHWIACDIQDNKLEFNATQLNKIIVQGQNSSTEVGWLRLKGEKPSEEALLKHANYTGPFPPDQDHVYEVNIYALDVPTLNLKPGYFLDELYKKMRDHILAHDTYEFEYKKI